jgi:hypothetical protein
MMGHNLIAFMPRFYKPLLKRVKRIRETLPDT